VVKQHFLTQMFTDEMQMWSKKHIKFSNQIQSVIWL